MLPLNPRPGFSRALAAEVNGEGRGDSSRVIAVGVGALGSQVVSNLVRGGFGQWTLVDHDLLQSSQPWPTCAWRLGAGSAEVTLDWLTC